MNGKWNCHCYKTAYKQTFIVTKTACLSCSAQRQQRYPQQRQKQPQNQGQACKTTLTTVDNLSTVCVIAQGPLGENFCKWVDVVVWMV